MSVKWRYLFFTTSQFAKEIGRGSRCKKITPVFLVIGLCQILECKKDLLQYNLTDNESI
jgi:hypothetical protein